MQNKLIIPEGKLYISSKSPISQQMKSTTLDPIELSVIANVNLEKISYVPPLWQVNVAFPLFMPKIIFGILPIPNYQLSAPLLHSLL